MTNVRDHYESHLADIYTWLFGGFDVKCQESKDFFTKNSIKPIANGKAIDLGCGSGFQSIPLAQLGFNVTGIDISSKLLTELSNRKNDLPIVIINEDLKNFDLHCKDNVDLIICMGDTLTHLDTKDDVKELIKKAYLQLTNGGYFIITYRDLSFELKELDRFIPVNSDDSKIFTCFLEYEDETVKVHDLLYKRENNNWVLKKSFYKKLRLSSNWVINHLEDTGFIIEKYDSDKGLCTIIARRNT